MAVGGIDSYLNSYLSPYSWTQGTSSSNSVWDYAGAQKNAQAEAASLMEMYNGNKATVSGLKKDTAQFLDSYTKSLKSLDQAASNIRLDNLDKILYDKEGNITDSTIKATVDATQKFVDQYNSTLKLMNDNAERGPGTMKQLGRMVQDPAPEAGMALIGVTVNKDGTLSLDAEKMTKAFKESGPENQKLYRDILGGFGGIADNTHKNAQFGLNTSARDLILNDLATIKATQAENPFRELYDSFRGNVYNMNNQAVGIMMNMLV
ncbi:hypothetical protein LJC49_00385 [Ruminococcaceae bacterium OttesenSCG-928-I18]|nr:hypothetical protein [Ruminococcaceae bacterium OttesenSCG-928-I18]